MPWEISARRRQQYREVSIRSQQRKLTLLRDNYPTAEGLTPALDAAALAPRLETHGLSALSLFSGGGGLDLGFERAGYQHVAAFDVLEVCGNTLRKNRPNWKVFSGEQGDVEGVSWSKYRGAVDVLHGGPPCQPFSIAGKRRGSRDPRNMWPAYVAAVLAVRPKVFLAENVPGLLEDKFARFVEQNIFQPLQSKYWVHTFRLSAECFGVPQARKRVFIVGFSNERDALRFFEPAPTHDANTSSTLQLLPLNTARRALGLPDIGFDALAPTIRSGFTGPRNTTGIVNSKASLAIWDKLHIWPNGVQSTRALAAAYLPENGHQRLAVPDCALLQGFTHDWNFSGAVYQALGQIGNSVCPPVAYWVARSVAAALGKYV